MNETTTNPKLVKLITSISFLLIGMSVAFGHGDKKHDSNKTSQEAPVDSMHVAQSAALDSIYASIQSGFTALEPTFSKGCFDCHTTRTNFPWYYKLPIVKGMIEDDITEAKEHMDMSDGFPFGGHGKPVDDLVALREVMENGEMPPLKYRMMHWSAKPSDSERDSIVDWIESGLASLASIGVHPTEKDGDQDHDADHDEDHDKGVAESDSAYACPMHPEITSDHQEKCSLCGMSLEATETDSHSDDGHDH